MDGVTFDLAQTPLREVNRFLHQPSNGQPVQILNPDGAHNIAVGLDAPVEVEIAGHAGYYAAGMNKLANVTILGNVGPGVAENMMSGQSSCQGLCFCFCRSLCSRRTAHH